MSGQLTVTVTTLAGGMKKILSPHAVLEDGKRRATGGCQLREREGHHPLRGEQHDCLQLPGISQAPAGGRKSSSASTLCRRLAKPVLQVHNVNLS